MIYHLLWRRFLGIYCEGIHRLDMVHILYIMLNFDEVYISDIPPAISIATWYMYVLWYVHRAESTYNILFLRPSDKLL